MSVTELECRHAKPGIKPYRLHDTEGLFLDIRTSGKRIWRQRCYIGGKEKLLTIGVYPAVSLVKAREKRDATKEQIALGNDPCATKQAEKRLARYAAAQTVELVCREWIDAYGDRWSKRHKDTMLSRLEAYVFPSLGSIPFRELTPPVVFACVKRIEDRKKYELAHRVLQIIGQACRYAVVTGRAEKDVTKDLRGALRPYTKSHFAAIEPRELPELLQKIERNEARLYPQTLVAMKFMVHTFVRTKELLEARWEEFDLVKAEWHIPAERMKMKRPHLVPLSNQAIALLHELKQVSKKGTGERGPNYLFPSVTLRDRPLSNTTLLMALRRMKYCGRMTGHGFRALAMSTIKEQLGYRHEVVDRQLAHQPKGKVNQAYDRAQFIDERKKMMQEWSDYLGRCVIEAKKLPIAA